LEYGDYECPFCGQGQPIVKEIQRPLGDLCFAFQQLTAKGITRIHTLTVNKMQQKMKESQQEPIVVLPNTGEELNIAGSQTFHKIKSKDTNGVFSVMEFVTPPGKGVALHVHEREDELVYLLDGEIESHAWRSKDESGFRSDGIIDKGNSSWIYKHWQ
jgi:mannose-6-phosphate isomerase-like protein (cupin superfamily)